MRRLNRTTANRLEQLERQLPPPASFFHWNRIATENAKEFIEKVSALPEGGLLEDAGLSAECWLDLIENLTVEARAQCLV